MRRPVNELVTVTMSHLGYGDGLLLHGFVNGDSVVLSHLVKLINTNNPSVRQHHGPTLHNKPVLKQTDYDIEQTPTRVQ